MKILFENITEYNKNEINKFQEFHAKINIPYVLYLFFLLILLIFLLVVNIIRHNWKWVIGCFVLGSMLFVYYKFFKKEKDKINNIKVTDKRFKFDFYDNYLTATDISKNNNGHSTTNYFEIKKVYETEENFYLYMGETYSLVINKNNFTIGKLNDFREFIKKKCILRYRKRYILSKSPKAAKNKKKTDIKNSNKNAK